MMNTLSKEPGAHDSRIATTSMKIYFCDICNESIPLKDINSNSITIERGKIFCQKCAPKPSRRSSVSPWLLLTLLGLTLGLLALAVWLYTSLSAQRQDSDAQRTTLALLEADLRTAAQEQRVLETGLRELLGAQAAHHSEFTVARSELQRRQEAVEQKEVTHSTELRGEIAKTSKDLIGKLESINSQLQAELVDSKLQMEGLRAQQIALKERIGLMEMLIATGAKSAATAPSEEGLTKEEPGEPPAPEGGSAPSAVPPAPESLFADLESTDSGRRYSAVLASRGHSGDRVVEAVTARLGASAAHNRIAVIESLRLMKAIAATERLIQSLRDKEYLVRMYAARSVRELTGQSLAFDPDGNGLDREKQVKAWEAWWTANRDSLLPRGK